MGVNHRLGHLVGVALALWAVASPSEDLAPKVPMQLDARSMLYTHIADKREDYSWRELVDYEIANAPGQYMSYQQTRGDSFAGEAFREKRWERIKREVEHAGSSRRYRADIEVVFSKVDEQNERLVGSLSGKGRRTIAAHWKPAWGNQPAGWISKYVMELDMPAYATVPVHRDLIAQLRAHAPDEGLTLSAAFDYEVRGCTLGKARQGGLQLTCEAEIVRVKTIPGSEWDQADQRLRMALAELYGRIDLHGGEFPNDTVALAHKGAKVRTR